MAISIVELKKALDSLDEAIILASAREKVNEVEFKLFRDACIQRFEFCIELSWKISAKLMGSSSTISKPVIREMAQNGLIDDVPKWFSYIDARNKTSHSYDEDIAKSVYESAKSFMVDGKNLFARLAQFQGRPGGQ